MSKEHEDKAESTINAEPDKVTPRHRALMRRLVAGMKLSDACDDIGFSISRASLIVNSPLFQAEMKTMEAEVAREFQEAEAQRPTDPVRVLLTESAEKAAKTLDGALSDENVMARVNAAKDILDRTGYAKEDKIKAKVLVEPSQSLIDVMSRIVKEKRIEPDDAEQD
jgi:malonyl CoA-acyl carrier protein transacylase